MGRILIITVILLFTGCTGRIISAGNNQFVIVTGADVNYNWETADHLPDAVHVYFVFDGNEEDNHEELFWRLIGSVSAYIEFPVESIVLDIVFDGELFSELTLDLLNVESTSLELPVLIINGIAYQGMPAISSNIREAVFTAGNDLFLRGYVYNPRYAKTGENLWDYYEVNEHEITIIYLYRTVCPSCTAIQHLFQNAPESVTIDGEEVRLNIIMINTRSGNNPDRARVLFDAFEVPAERRSVPIVITMSGYFIGITEITAMFENLARADRLGFQFPVQE